MYKKKFVQLSRTVYALRREKRSVLSPLCRLIAPPDEIEKWIVMMENKGIDDESLTISHFFDNCPDEFFIAR